MRHHLGKMHGLSMAQLHDLLPATESVSDHDGHRSSRLDRRQQTLTGNRFRNFELTGFKPEWAGHAAASGFDQVNRRPRLP
jgi:hypothetical protein